MTAPFFTTNDSEVTRLEGLYVKERNPPSGIVGANFSDVSVGGTAIRGPVDRAVLCSSPSRVIEVFGGRDQGSGGIATSNIWKALINKPFGRVWITRVAAAAATKATKTLTGAACATGTITCVAQSLMVDTETVTISDGVLSKVYEFDKAGDGVTGGRIAVNISGATSANDVANALASAISTSGQSLAVSVAGAVVSLTNTVAGTAGNVSITEAVANAGFLVSGMSGGTASGTALATVNATSPGQWGNNISSLVVALATDGNASHFNLTPTYLGRDYAYKNLDLSPGSDNTATVIGTDDGNVIAVTKLASGVPTAGTYAMTGGSDGTVADSDYTAAGRGINVVDAVKNTVACWVAEYESSAVKAVIKTLAAARSSGFWLMGPDADTTALSAAVTEAASNRNDAGRIYYTFNHPYTVDPETAVEMVTRPESWLAAVLSQTDVDIHPGEEDTKQFLAGITRLSFPSLSRGDYISLKDAGIIGLEEDEGFSFVSGVTTSLVPGKEQGTRRRMTDFIQLSLAANLKHDVKKKNTVSRRAIMKAKIETFLRGLQKAERVVDPSDNGSDNFKVDNESLNTDAQRALGVERIFVKVRIVGHLLYLVVETEIGTSVTVKEAA